MLSYRRSVRIVLRRRPPSYERNIRKLVVIGGTGLIGSKLVTRLREQGPEAVAASPDTGVDTLTGKGPGRGPSGRVGRRRCLELSVVRGDGCDGVLHHVHA
jgi:nucleoside-diphosphate-sugar epimerase